MTPYVENPQPKKRNIKESPLNNIPQQERIRIITEELVKGKSKRAIIIEYCDKWECKPATIKAVINESIAYLHSLQTGNTPEELRSGQVAKLEELYQDSPTSDKLKIIDLVSKTLGLYNNSLTVKTDNEVKINLGV